MSSRVNPRPWRYVLLLSNSSLLILEKGTRLSEVNASMKLLRNTKYVGFLFHSPKFAGSPHNLGGDCCGDFLALGLSEGGARGSCCCDTTCGTCCPKSKWLTLSLIYQYWATSCSISSAESLSCVLLGAGSLIVGYPYHLLPRQRVERSSNRGWCFLYSPSMHVAVR